MSEFIPYTERSNEITENIDACNGTQVVKLLQKTDAQVFRGINDRNLYDESVLNAIAGVANLIRTTLLQYDAKDVAVVLSGSGTSGRLSFYASRIANTILGAGISSGPFFYTIAGGDMSVLTSQEAPEDDVLSGKQYLIKVTEGKRKVIYIAISCGISAPFVAGQLEYCMEHLDTYFPVLIGFNPLHMARNVKIKNWKRTMREVAYELDELAKTGRAFIINPILGPEAITGSSRMKGGTATKTILEAIIFSVANGLRTKDAITPSGISALFRIYEQSCREFYDINDNQVIGKLIEKCGDSLKKQGKIRYLSSGWGGVLAVIDSTECPPTYGSHVDDIRGFLLGGYNFLQIKDFGCENDLYKLGLEDILDIYHSTTQKSNDTVLVFMQSAQDPLLEKLAENISHFRKMTAVADVVAVLMDDPASPRIDISEIQNCFSEVIRIQYPNCNQFVTWKWDGDLIDALVLSLQTSCFKLVVNALSTGANVLLGKIYKNYMCNLHVSNSKLYHRVIGLIQTLCNDVNEEKAKACLWKSIYEVDLIDDEIASRTVSQHYRKAAGMKKVVPLALIIAGTDCTVDVAKDILKSNPVVRIAIQSGRKETSTNASSSDNAKIIQE